MITNCRRCHRPYWRYWRGELPSDRFCSVACQQDHDAQRKQGPPPMPAEIARQIRQHMLLTHNDKGRCNFYDECYECGRLQEQHADSVWYYLDRVIGVAS